MTTTTTDPLSPERVKAALEWIHHIDSYDYGPTFVKDTLVALASAHLAMIDPDHGDMDLPHAIKRARRYLFEHSRRPSQAEFSDALPDAIAVLTEHAEASLAPIIAAVEAHLAATKREPPAGLVEVIDNECLRYSAHVDDTGKFVVVNATLPNGQDAEVHRCESFWQANGWISAAIARAVVEFATSDEAMTRLENACPRGLGRDDVEPQALVRAALGATEEGNG